MSYPINDVFEGVSDLLLKHGISKFTSFNGDTGTEDNYLKYGGYNYLVTYVNGDLHTITRLKREENSDGKN